MDPLPEPRRRKKTNSSSSNGKEPLSTGNEYPFDVWFLISQHIRPEDVGRFASICKASHSVVCTAQFWLSMYKRFYNYQSSLPECLRPVCLSRLYGLKASVIRALQFTYPPYICRLKKAKAFEDDLQVLCKRQCVLMWHKSYKTHWLYYFKLKKINNTVRAHNTDDHEPNLLEILEDVCANPDENCRILQVTCSEFAHVPSVFGQTLNSVCSTLSISSCVTKIRLGFGSGIQVCGARTPDGTVIVLDSVIGMKILDWWHPLYPHDNSLQFLLNRDRE